MDDVKSLSSLRALILNGTSLIRNIVPRVSNVALLMPSHYHDWQLFAPYMADNEISSVCKLDQMKELNTLGTCFNLCNIRWNSEPLFAVLVGSRENEVEKA